MSIFSKCLQYFRRPGYDAVEKRSSGRDAVTAERTNEDAILPTRKRRLLVSSQRDNFRNTTFSPATALQLQINVVGNIGGHLTFTTEDADFNKRAGTEFRRWARHAEFVNGISLNELLQLSLVQLTHNGGDFIAVFDDGILTSGRGSGKVRIFETDEIKPVEDKVFERIYGKDSPYWQSNGIVKDQFGRVCGAFVTSVGREKDILGEGEFIHLELATPADFSDSDWIFVGQWWRTNQGRGIATSTHITNTLKDLADTIASEVQASKMNSGIGLLISDKGDSAVSDEERGLGLDTEDVGNAQLSPEEEAELAENVANGGRRLKEGQSAVFSAPPGKDISSFDTKRPNNNVVGFIDRLQSQAATVFGFSSTFVTLEPETSFTAYRGAMIIAQKAFEKYQKKLERDLLDWLAVRVVKWLGIAAPSDFDCCLFWSWPEMSEVDESSFQTALEKKFTNFEATLQSRHGADWRKRVDQLKEEVDYCSSVGILHPSLRTVSGGQVEVAEEPTEQPVNDKEGEE